MGGKEDGLELSLSLGPKKLMQSTSHHHHHHHLHRKNHQRIISNWNHHLFQASDINSKISHKDESKIYLRGGFDVDWVPPPLPVEISGGDNENVEASSPNSTVSSGSGKREPSSSRDDNCVIVDAFAGDEVDRGGGGDALAAKKKLRLSKEQSVVLEETFKERSTLNPRQKVALAKQLKLRPRQVEVWFQNRRARTKLKQTEVDCEYLRRCCENLAEENRLLQKDVMELRALKLSSPHLYVHVPPPAATCPACEPAVSSPEAATDTCHQHLVGPARPMPVPARSWTPMQFRPPDAHGPPP